MSDVEIPRVAAVVLAAGSGTRVGSGPNKVLREVAGVPVLVWSLRAALEVPGLHRCVIVVRADEHDEVAAAVTPYIGERDVWLVHGGDTRHGSETRALAALRHDIETGEIDVVAIHDAARPLASPDLWRRTVAAAATSGGAIPVLDVSGLLARSPGADPRGGRDPVAVQTPQAFRSGPLLAAYDAAERDGFTGTDTAASLAAHTDTVVVPVTGEPANLKITFADDVALADALLTGRLTGR